MSNSILEPQVKFTTQAQAIGVAKAAIRRLLVSQYQSTGAQKSQSVLRAIGQRIEALDGNVPAICVAQRRLETTRDLIVRAIAVIPHLAAFDAQPPGSGISSWYAQAVQSALADAYKMAVCQATLGFELKQLNATADFMQKDKIIEGMIISPNQYIELLKGLKELGHDENATTGLWLADGDKGRPMPILFADIAKMDQLRKHLPELIAKRFYDAVEEAKAALTARTNAPVKRRPRDRILAALKREIIADEVQENIDAGILRPDGGVSVDAILIQGVAKAHMDSNMSGAFSEALSTP